MYIGLNNLKQIVLSYEISQMKAGLFNKCAFIWTHSNRTNLIFQDLYVKYYKVKVPAIISSAGIVHDIGKIIMLQIFGIDYYNKIILNPTEAVDLLKLERDLYEIDHSELGGYFLNWWAFPLDLVEITLYHHTPDAPEVSNKALVALMCMASHIEENDSIVLSEPFMNAMDILKVAEPFYLEIQEKYHTQDHTQDHTQENTLENN
jgi:HD-like signal output (HDOD) protein